MRRHLLLAALCPALALTLPLAAPSRAQGADAAPAPSQDEAAIAALNKELGERWDPSQRGQFVYLGYHSAAAALCDGLELDPAKLSRVIHESFLEGADQLSADDRAKLNDAVLGHLALATGVFMGLRSHDAAAFCAEARNERNSAKDSSSLFKD